MRLLRLETLSRGRWAYPIIALVVLIASAPGVFSLPALDRDEARFAQASKQMLETEDYIRIREQSDLRNKKPAGIHWLQAGSTALFSSAEAKEIWSYRLPSLVGGMVAAMLTFWAGWPLIGRQAAFMGSILFASTLLLTTEAHYGKTDAVLMAFTILGMGALIRLYLARSTGFADQKGMALLFWAAMGLGFLIKGPITPMVAFLTMGALFLWERRANWMKPVAWWPGPLLFVLLVLPWFIWIQMATAGAFFEGAVGKDLADKVTGASEGHGGPPGYHLAFLTTHFFPATIILIPAVVLAVRALRGRLRHDEETMGLRVLICWLVPTWLVFEFLPTKLSHYVLPAYPALALICGWAAMRLMEGARAPVSRWFSFAFFAAGTAVIAFISTPWGIRWAKEQYTGDFRTMDRADVLAAWSTSLDLELKVLAVGVIAATIALVLAAQKRITAMVGAGVVASILITTNLRTNVLPQQTWLQATETGRIALAELCALPDDNPERCGTATERVRAVYYAEPSLPFTTGTDTTIATNRPADNTVISVRDGDRLDPVEAFLIDTEHPGNDTHDGLSGQQVLELLEAEASEMGLCTRRSGRYPAFNYSNGDPVVFVALRIEACR